MSATPSSATTTLKAAVARLRPKDTGYIREYRVVRRLGAGAMG